MINKKTLATICIPILIIMIVIYGNRLFFDDTKGKVITRLSFNFAGVDDGLNPHGGNFDAQRIKKTEVIENALKQLANEFPEIEAKQIAQNIMIRGIVPKDAIDRISPTLESEQTSYLEGVRGATYHPTQYEVALILNKDLNLSKEQGQQILEALISSYQAYFAETYKDTQAIEAAITPIDPERYDYSEYIMLTQGQLKIIKNYLSAKEQVAKDFRSSNTHLSFGDLIAQVELIDDIEVGNVKALVDSFLITKDTDQLSIVSESMIQRMKLEKEKHTKQAEELTRAANAYEKDKTIVMGNGTLLQGLEEDDDEESLYDGLIRQAVEARARANRMNSQQQYYEELVANVNKQKESGTQAGTSYHQEVEQSIAYISEQMNTVMENITTTVNDYYAQEVFEGSVMMIMEPTYRSNFRSHFIKDTLLIDVFIGLLAMLGAVFLLAKKEFKTK